MQNISVFILYINPDFWVLCNASKSIFSSIIHICSYLRLFHVFLLAYNCTYWNIYHTEPHTAYRLSIHQISIIFLKIPSLSVTPGGDNLSTGKLTSRSSAQRRLPEPVGTRSTGYSPGHTEIHGSARTGGPWAWFHLKLELQGCFSCLKGEKKAQTSFWGLL